MKFNFINIFIAILLSITNIMVAQRQLSLDEAITIALGNNAKLRYETKQVQYQQALVNTAYRFNPTVVNAELGQFNSAYFDTGIGISQAFSLPKVYRLRAHANREQVKTAEAFIKLSEAEIRQQLDELFMEYSYLLAKEKLLVSQDSLYNAFVLKSNIRWEKGESDVLEKTTAEQQQLNISNQILMVKKMKDFLVLHLKWLLNDGLNYIPRPDDFSVLKYNILVDSMSVGRHPALIAFSQEIQAAKAFTQAEKTARLPELNAGYRNVSIRGTGADNLVYQGGDRFSSFQLGVGIPIFRKGIKAAIQSAEKMEEVKESNYEAKRAEISTSMQQQWLLYNETAIQLTQYEQKALPNARTIRRVSENQFASGQINYLEYVMLTNQAISIESEYLELKRNLNTHIINLYYLTSNN
jgi:heavy metal efflux system protein